MCKKCVAKAKPGNVPEGNFSGFLSEVCGRLDGFERELEAVNAEMVVLRAKEAYLNAMIESSRKTIESVGPHKK